MAVFTSTNELQQQAQHKNFNKVTGWKKGAMSLLGYKDTGQKNAFGKFFGHGNVLLDSYVPGALAKGTDAEEVIKSQRGEEWAHQIGTAKLAANIITMGASGGATAAAGGATAGASGASGAAVASQGGGLFSKAGTMGKGQFGGATKAGAFISKAGGGSSRTALQGGASSAGLPSMFKEGSKANNLLSGEAGQKLTNEITAKGKQKVMDEMDKASSSDDTSDVPEADVVQDALGDATAQAGNALVDTTGESTEAKQMQGVAKATSAIPIIGEAAGLYAHRLQMAQGYKNKRKEISGRTYRGNEAHRA